MIEILILIAVALIGILLVLGRISLTLKEMLDSMVAPQSASGKSARAQGDSGQPRGFSSERSPLQQSELGSEPSPHEHQGSAETLQDIAAVVAVAERAIRERSLNARES